MTNKNENKKEKNAKKEQKKLLDSDLENIIEKIKKGISLSEICDSLGITPYVIKKIIKNDKDFAEEYRSANSLYAQRKIDEIKSIGDEVSVCSDRKALTRVKSAELQVECIVKHLSYSYPERYKEKNPESYIDFPEFAEANTPKERLSLIAKAVCEKRISLEAAERLAKICEIELRITDFHAFSEDVAARICRMEKIISATSNVTNAKIGGVQY